MDIFVRNRVYNLQYLQYRVQQFFQDGRWFDWDLMYVNLFIGTGPRQSFTTTYLKTNIYIKMLAQKRKVEAFSSTEICKYCGKLHTDINLQLGIIRYNIERRNIRNLILLQIKCYLAIWVPQLRRITRLFTCQKGKVP